MHNSHQSFAARQRVLQKMGHSDHQVIWFSDTVPTTLKASQTFDALAVMDRWLMNIRANPGAGIAANRPPMAVDACYDRNGQLMQSGAGVWDDILGGRPAGACTQAFPLDCTSRVAAGAQLEGGIYDCARKPVATAAVDGTYGRGHPARLRSCRPSRTFPEGAFDYSKPDQARP